MVQRETQGPGGSASWSLGLVVEDWSAAPDLPKAQLLGGPTLGVQTPMCEGPCPKGSQQGTQPSRGQARLSAGAVYVQGVGGRSLTGVGGRSLTGVGPRQGGDGQAQDSRQPGKVANPCPP